MKKEILLENELIGHSAGNRLKPVYRARLVQRDGKEPSLQVGETMKDGTINWGSQWYLKTLVQSQLTDIDDEMWIDYGQRWSVSGMILVLKEALRKVSFDITL